MPKRTRPQRRSARWRRRAAGSSSHMRYPRPARRERKSRDPGSGRQGARGRGGDVRHSVREGARERRGRSSGECERRGQQARWARRARRPRGRRPGPRLCSRFPPRPPVPLGESAQGGGGIDSGRCPGRRAGPRAIGGAGIWRRGRGCRGREPGSVQDLFCGRCSYSAAPSSLVRSDRGQAGRLLSWEVRSLRPTLLAGSRLAQIAGPAEVRASPSQLNDFVACGRAWVTLGREPSRGIPEEAARKLGKTSRPHPACGGRAVPGPQRPFVRSGPHARPGIGWLSWQPVALTHLPHRRV